MRRQLLAPAAAAVTGAALVAYMGLRTMAFSDYEAEAEPALFALRDGDLAAFLDRSPAYAGSLILRAPFALLPELWGGGDLALYRSMAVPCLAAGVVLAVMLWRRLRGIAAWLALALAVANPLTLRALEIGHPEELLGGVLCVGAALAAGAARPRLAGLLLGLAVANKPWAVVAVGPVVLMLRAGRVGALAIAGATAAAVMAPVLVHGGGALTSTAAVARSTGQIFQPWQLWWFLGEHGAPVFGLLAEKPGYRTAPEWIGPVSRALVVLAPLVLSLLCARRLSQRRWQDGLLLLALVLLLRCLLDPWNTVYYALPFALALLAWEVHAHRRPPIVAAGATALVWVSFETLPPLVGPDVQAAAYLSWSVPLAAALALRILAPERWARLAAPVRARLTERLPGLARRLAEPSPAS